MSHATWPRRLPVSTGLERLERAGPLEPTAESAQRGWWREGEREGERERGREREREGERERDKTERVRAKEREIDEQNE